MNIQSLASAALLLLGAAAPGTLAADEDFNPEGLMDSAYILPCDRSQGYYPVYCADGCTYGPGWYCNSGEWVGDKYDTCNGEQGCAHLGGGDFDVAHIYHSCSGWGICKNTIVGPDPDDDCVYFNTDYNMWMCNDASELEEDKEESKMLRGEVAVE